MANNITDLLEEVKDEICDRYCKFPREYSDLYEDKNVAHECMLQDVCTDCPLTTKM